jgi:hypothetical protein
METFPSLDILSLIFVKNLQEDISSPIAHHIREFYDDGGGGGIFSIDDPSPPSAISSADVAGPSTTTDSNPTTDLTVAFENFQSLDPATINAVLETPIPSDTPFDQPQTQQQQQQSVPSINYSNLLPQCIQSLNSSDFPTQEDNQAKAPGDMNSPAAQFLMRAPPTNLLQVPMQIQQQGGLMGIKSNVFPLQMMQQDNTNTQRFFHGGSSSNRLSTEPEGMTHYGSEGRELRRIFSSGDIQVTLYS